MTPARWKQIDDLFPQVVDLDAGARTVFLDESCRDDPELRRELESLIDASTGAERSLRSVIEHEAESLADAAVTAQVGRRIGSYRLLESLGEGGMGVVYRAVRDDNEYQRDVAIKILRYGLDSQQAIARFRDERQILARLDHPNIVRLLDGGTTDDNLPYLVMEHLKGVSITQHARGLPVRDRVALAVTICDAVHYAHRLMIVHRDIKPSNILVGADGAPKLLDFGIAKLLDGEAREARTIAGSAMLTIEYASPEQLRGAATSIATDIYSLGAVLYELLADRPPHVAPTVEMIRAVNDLDAVRPSTVAPLDRRAGLVGDLDNIVLKAVHREASGRYASAAQFADDLRRYLDGLPVIAIAPTLRYRAGKWLRRNRTVVGVVGAAVVVAGVAVGLAWRHDAARTCESSAKKLAGVWDPAVGATIETAFRGTGRTHASGTFTRVAAALDEHANAWIAMRTEACEATARGEQSSQLLDLRMQCLDRRLGQVRALTELFAHPDASLVDNAVAAVYRLEDLHRCADARGLLDATPPPADAIASKKVAALRDRLAPAEALYNAGRYREAEAADASVVAEARTLAYPPVLAEALLAMAGPQMYLYEDAAAQKTLEEAMLVAAAANDDGRIALAWIRLVNVLGIGLSKPVEAMAMRLGAETAIARAGNDRRQRALLDRNLGSVLKIQGKYDEALAMQREALTLLTATVDPNDPDLGGTRNSIGVVLMRQGKLDEALAQFEDTLAFFVRVYGPEHPSVAGILINTGNLQVRKGRYADAVKLLERALAIQTQTLDANHPDVAETLGSLGTARAYLGDLAGASRDTERALAIAQKALPADHLQLASALRRAGAIRVAFGKVAEGKAAIDRALEIYEAKLDPNNPAIAEALDALGAAQLALGNVEQAGATYKRALAIEMGDHGGATQAATETELAVAELMLRGKATTDGLADAEHALATRIEIFGDAHPQVGGALAVKGDMLVALGRTPEAIPVLERAVAILEVNGPPVGLARAQFSLARALPPHDDRIKTLTAKARAGLVDVGPPGAPELAKLDAWISSR